MKLPERQDKVILASSEAQRFGVDYFLTVLNTEEDPLCRWYAVRALGNMRASKAKEQLLRVLRQPDVEFDESTLHRICAWAIGRIGFELTDDVIAFLEGTNTTEAKIAAIDALGEIKNPKAIDVLTGELYSDDRQVRVWAALALAKIGEDALSVLKDALESADRELVYTIVDALAIIATERTLPILKKAIRRDKETVRAYFAAGPKERVENYVAMIRTAASHDDLGFIAQVLERAN